MSVFDFNAEAKEERKNAKCTFTVFRSNETTATPEHPILVLDNREKQWEHHSKGVFIYLKYNILPFFCHRIHCFFRDILVLL